MIRSLNRILLAVATVLVALATAVAMAVPTASAEPTDSPGSTTATTSTATTSTATTTAPDTTTPSTTPSTTPPSTTTPPSSTVTPPETGTGSVTVQAIDLKTHLPVSGVGVELRSGNVIKVVNTFASVDMPAGVVSAQVTAIPGGYQRAWVDPSSANLVAGGSTSFLVSLVRKGQVGAVSITKRDKVTGALLAGASYRVTAVHSDQSVMLVTGPSGTGSVQLAPGGYNVQEVGAPAGYALDSTVRFVEVSPSQTRYLELYDSPIEQPVIIRDPSQREPLTSIPTGRTH
ncbi:MSCRAMM family protein [Gordonia sp. MP11Mi]|uniref:SpaA-like prealbumin fold domain-containing protein n=1 Tax=Gordonia sp. MP11Mi TaxID=3022769 RepID=A0AA97GWV2_9ACTN